MKTPITTSVNGFRLTFLALLTALVWATGCATSRHHPSPLLGWSGMGSITWNGLKTPGERPPPLPDAITEDYQDYIHKLPMLKGYLAGRSESYFIDQISFFEDGAGRHAVEIEIPLYGVEWKHVLIYDKENKRTNVIKYASGRYRS